LVNCTIKEDFDRLAHLDSEGWTHNNHYHPFLIKHVPKNCENALDIGCGTGAFSRLLASRSKHVIALDLSQEMIRVAQAHSADFQNIRFEVADAMTWSFPNGYFDCIATIATLHHLQTEEFVSMIKQSLKVGGTLIVMDLFEPDGFRDKLLSLAAMGMSSSLRMLRNGQLRPTPAVQAAWAAHGKHDSYLKISQVHSLCKQILPGAQVKKHLLWRYSIFWQKPA
jgi:ubiquinone/menaquinone biosynthesis C-methylase UbiE